ncbi:MAG: class I SAM-dependent methyltransferase [Planctomycetota bacterium]
MKCRACGSDAPIAFTKDRHPLGLCPGCGSLSRATGGDLARHYADYLPEATLRLPPATRARYREILAGLGRFGEPGERRLLDVGAGAGLFLEVARDEGWEAEGVELSARAAEEAARRSIRVHVGDLADLDLEGGFDAAVSFETLEHVPDPAGFLSSIRAVLRPGGGLLVSTPNFGSLNRRILGREWLPIAPDHLCLLTPRALRSCLERAGFRVLSITSRTLLVTEALKRFRRPPTRRQGFDAKGTAALQETFETRGSLRLVKAVANAILGATGLGDALVALAARGGEP